MLATPVEEQEVPWLYCQRTGWKWFAEDNYAWRLGCYYSHFKEKAQKIHLLHVGLSDPDDIDFWGWTFTPEIYGFYHLPIVQQEEE